MAATFSPSSRNDDPIGMCEPDRLQAATTVAPPSDSYRSMVAMSIESRRPTSSVTAANTSAGEVSARRAGHASQGGLFVRQLGARPLGDLRAPASRQGELAQQHPGDEVHGECGCVAPVGNRTFVRRRNVVPIQRDNARHADRHGGVDAPVVGDG